MNFYYIELTKYNEQNGEGDAIDTITLQSLEKLKAIQDNLQIHQDIVEDDYVFVEYFNEEYRRMDFQFTTYELVKNTLGIEIK